MVQYLQFCEKSYFQVPLGGVIGTTILLQILIINTWLNTFCLNILFFSFFFFHRIQDVGYGNGDGSPQKEGEKGEHD